MKVSKQKNKNYNILHLGDPLDLDLNHDTSLARFYRRQAVSYSAGLSFSPQQYNPN